MQLNADLSLPATAKYSDTRWVKSPGGEVDRGMLDRDGDEVARATSLVRYAAGSAFPPHTHGGGEEFYVLEGVFGDEHGEYPAGWYVRNKVGSSHSPRVGPTGCLIFVKLRWMRPDEPDLKLDTRPLADHGWHTLYADPVTPESVAVGVVGVGPTGVLDTAGDTALARLVQNGWELVVAQGQVEVEVETVSATGESRETVRMDVFDWLRRPASTSGNGGISIRNVGTGPAKVVLRAGYMTRWLQ
ncbi:hypothetical protein M427DRAFT_135703 [Gonapodya prolifera JEL478]|uniref:ChrR-like cupin domain-containing protein n=1 Tax=Gonapodya prolifera (strain JEL478) TaxID=1344416 RepID=A0A139ACT7_GONPJ|nr:hypothetical protein M427DRAFT_135703 [Gonapodya prolifera JEL478]|eukprot:KXS14580.1 hypothetical protein M427DRAFT_135703 [Gonapodya prolifera JEL478]